MPRKRKDQQQPATMGSFISKKPRNHPFSEDTGIIDAQPTTPTPATTRTTRSNSHLNTPAMTSSSSSSHSGGAHAAGIPSAQADSAAFVPARCSMWFDLYKDKDSKEEIIGPEGVEAFCNDLGVTPDNIVVLIIAWKMGAVTMGYFTKEEWMGGMRKMNCDTTQKLRNHLEKLPLELNDPASFKDLYRYSFDFSKEKTQKSMDVNTAVAIWMMLMKDRSQHTQSFISFLEQKAPVKVINKDQWMNFLEFCDAVKPDLSNYDENSAWPVLLDEYVAWRKETQM